MSEQLTIGGLFEGYGGLTMAVQRVLGGELAWYSEIEPAANRVLEYHHPGVPNLGDITAVDWSAVSRVNVLTGGFPCQDVSSAGLRTGLRAGTRSGLWSHMATAIDSLRPDLVVIENVRGILSTAADGVLEPCPWCVGDDESVPLRALGCVLGDLANIGYDTQRCGLRASDVGAPHARFRVVVLAWPAANAHGIGSAWAGGTRDRWCGDPHHDLTLADPAGDGRNSRRAEPAGLFGGSDAALGGDAATADPDCGEIRQQSGQLDGQGRPGAGIAGDDGAERQSLEWGAYEPAIRRWERILGRPAPAPTQPGKRGGPQLSPIFVEWLMGLDEGYVTDVPGVSRSETLKLLGNGVIPQQIEAGIRFLLPAMLGEVAR